MSLINEALKKAQRQRAAAEGSSAPEENGGSPMARPGKRGRAMPAQTVLLIVSGAAALIVVSVVLTVFLLAPSKPAPEAEPAQVAEAPAPEKALPAKTTPSPVVTLPDIKPAEKALPPPPPPKVEPVKPTPEPPRDVAPVPDERAYAFIDKLQVMGIRSSGADSKVLMNDRVYRINDIVDRALGLKLVKVAPDSLTFTDPNGAIYTKNF